MGEASLPSGPGIPSIATDPLLGFLPVFGGGEGDECTVNNWEWAPHNPNPVLLTMP